MLAHLTLWELAVDFDFMGTRDLRWTLTLWTCVGHVKDCVFYLSAFNDAFAVNFSLGNWRCTVMNIRDFSHCNCYNLRRDDVFKA